MHSDYFGFRNVAASGNGICGQIQSGVPPVVVMFNDHRAEVRQDECVLRGNEGHIVSAIACLIRKNVLRDLPDSRSFGGMDPRGVSRANVASAAV